MYAYGIAVTPNPAQAAGAAINQASAKQSGGGGFAGTLLHVMGGGSEASSMSAHVSGLPSGMLGLAGLLAWSGADQDNSSEGLLKLIGNLAEQLGSLENIEQLPAELQNQLAALLLLAQNLLKAADSPETAASGQMYATNPALLQNAMVPKAGQSLTAELQQALQQLADKIAQGQVSGAQTAALAEQASQALSALKQFAGQKNKGLPSAVNTAATGDSEQTALASRAALVTALAAESADTAATSAPAPVWTLLKGGEHTLPGTGSASAHAQTPQSIPVQQFAQEMGKFMVKQFILSQGNGVSEAKISLQPEHLGQLDIKIVIQNGIMTAKFVAESGAAREMLEAQMAQLRTALQAQGLQVDRMEVVQQQPSQTHASYMGSHHGQQGTGHNGGGARKGNRGGYEDSAAFEAELDRTAFLREIGYGSTLNVTA